MSPARGSAFSGRRRPFLVAAALGGFAALFALVKTNRTAAVDLAVTLKVQASRSPAASAVLEAASWPGFPPQSRVIPPLVIGSWWLSGHRRSAAFQTAAWGSAAMSTAVKAAVRRDRPLPPQVRVVVAPLGGTSFPSGHVLTYTAFYGFLAYLVSEHVTNRVARRAGVVGLLGLVALVGPSRVQQGHHWATDVLASYCLGVAYALALALAYERSRP